MPSGYLFWDSIKGEDTHLVKIDVHEGNKVVFM